MNGPYTLAELLATSTDSGPLQRPTLLSRFRYFAAGTPGEHLWDRARKEAYLHAADVLSQEVAEWQAEADRQAQVAEEWGEQCYGSGHAQGVADAIRAVLLLLGSDPNVGAQTPLGREGGSNE